MATHNWNTSYQDLLSVTELPTLERRLDLKLGLLFKIMHKLCFLPDGIVKLREQSTLLSNTFSPSSSYISQEHLQILFSFDLYLVQIIFGILYPLILSMHHLLIILSIIYIITIIFIKHNYTFYTAFIVLCLTN